MSRIMAIQLVIVIALSAGLLVENTSAAAVMEQESTKPKEPGECAEEFRNWCRRSSFSRGNEAVFSSDYDIDGERVRRNCRINSLGMNCKQNGLSLFHCFPNGTLLYKENEVQEDYNIANDDICRTLEQVSCISINGNSVSIYGGCNSGGGGSVFVSGGGGSFSVNGGSVSSGDNEEHMREFHKKMKEFNEEMRDFQEKLQSDMRNLQESLKRFSG